MSIDVEFLKQVYQRFNARNIEAVLAALHSDVIWANGMEGGHLHGREVVRRLFTPDAFYRQITGLWAEALEPIPFSPKSAFPQSI